MNNNQQSDIPVVVANLKTSILLLGIASLLLGITELLQFLHLLMAGYLL